MAFKYNLKAILLDNKQSQDASSTNSSSTAVQCSVICVSSIYIHLGLEKHNSHFVSLPVWEIMFADDQSLL